MRRFTDFLNSNYLSATLGGHHWYPRLLVFRSEYGSMEVFVRARSRSVLARVLPIFGVASKDALVEGVNQALRRRPMSFTNGFFDFPSALNEWMDLEHLGTQP